MRALPLALLTLLPTAALAHPGDHAQTGWLHALTEPDHLLMLAIAGIGAFIAYRLWKRS
ncbi:hypothetical protein LCM17_04975 [Cereibacter sphaeroides]|nr:hypothetical protein [Cereibacter sphaeroides]